MSKRTSAGQKTVLIERVAAVAMKLSENTLLAVDIAIATLKARIDAGKANAQIMLLDLNELLKKREKLIKEITDGNQPTKDLPAAEKPPA